ncbi:AMP-dependent acyl-CoA synthetase [Advenella faeciporci]|uniref:AMP-dependent acyl-CoA synthetase n=1 Tax=Advenella faeciporci TaxID=797535 RepID=A0A918JJW1_9BURK|nr:class I adenylate-forming enzyme family protein [Advenella faeciporci]GGW83366.1 AMP-dependent acyl-CoA synthetase [Advenella faeciporci]
MILVSDEKISEYTEKGWWGTTTIWDIFQKNCAENPHAIAVIDASNRDTFMDGPARRLTWSDLARESETFAAILIENGIRKDDVLVMQLPNCIEQFLVYLACARLGVIVSPVPAQYRAHELRQILEISNAVGAICCSRIGTVNHAYNATHLFTDFCENKVAALRTVFSWGAVDSPFVVDVQKHMKLGLNATQQNNLHNVVRANPVTANDVFTICWTSGTEAFPKGIPRSHNEWLVITPSMTEGPELARHSRILNPFPLVNMAGISLSFMSWLQLCATVVQHNPFDLEVFLQQIRDEKIQYTLVAPTILSKLLKNESLLAGIDFNILKTLGSGSAPLPDWIVRTFKEKFNVQIINHFGSNEGAGFTSGYRDIPDPILRAKYFPRAGVEGFEWHVSTTKKIQTKLVDTVTGELITEPNRPGEMHYKGPNIFSCYYKNDAMTRNAFDDEGYYKLGDLFQIAGDRNQYYQYVGRCKDLVIRGGMNISTQEIESIISGYDDVLEVGIVSIPDDILGEKACACIVPRNDTLDFKALQRFMKEEKEIANFKIPEYLLLMNELPRNPVGKLIKHRLREEALTQLKKDKVIA